MHYFTSAFSKKNIFGILFLLIGTFGFAQLDVPNKPSKQTSVYDAADVLSNAEEKSLTQKLITYLPIFANRAVLLLLLIC